MLNVNLAASETIPASMTVKAYAKHGRSDLLAIVLHLTARLAEEVADGVVLSGELSSVADHCDALINENQDLQTYVNRLEMELTGHQLANIQSPLTKFCPLDEEVDRAIG